MTISDFRAQAFAVLADAKPDSAVVDAWKDGAHVRATTPGLKLQFTIEGPRAHEEALELLKVMVRE